MQSKMDYKYTLIQLHFWYLVAYSRFAAFEENNSLPAGFCKFTEEQVTMHRCTNKADLWELFPRLFNLC